MKGQSKEPEGRDQMGKRRLKRDDELTDKIHYCDQPRETSVSADSEVAGLFLSFSDVQAYFPSQPRPFESAQIFVAIQPLLLAHLSRLASMPPKPISHRLAGKVGPENKHSIPCNLGPHIPPVDGPMPSNPVLPTVRKDTCKFHQILAFIFTS
jgi:hypothetical protein